MPTGSGWKHQKRVFFATRQPLNCLIFLKDWPHFLHPIGCCKTPDHRCDPGLNMHTPPKANTMKHLTPLLPPLLAALGLAQALMTPVHAQTPLETAMLVITDLSQVNGQALACSDMKTARRAKDLMIAHAPKTARFGNAYEEGTQQSFATKIGTSGTCSDAAAFSAQLDVLEKRLQIALPITATTNQ